MKSKLLIEACAIFLVLIELSYVTADGYNHVFLNVNREFETLKTGDKIIVIGQFRKRLSQVRFMSRQTSCSGGTLRGSSMPPQCQPLVLKFYPRNGSVIALYKGEPNKRRDIFLESNSHSIIRPGQRYQLSIEVVETNFTVKLNNTVLFTLRDRFRHENVERIRFYGGPYFSRRIVQEPEPTVEIHSAVSFCGDRPGYIGFRIIGGTDASAGEFPWQAALRQKYTTSWTTYKHLCGATLINTCWVLTAAHCAERVVNSPHRYYIRLGDYYNKDDGANYTTVEDQQDINIIRAIVHENYSALPSAVNDIALIQLNLTQSSTGSSSCAKLSNLVRPICLPDRNENFAEGTQCIISGWGARDVLDRPQEFPGILQKATVDIKNFDRCQNNYGFEEDGTTYRVANETFCAAGRGRDSCQGDSGGPLVCVRNRKGSEQSFVLWGVTSWGDGCGQSDKPGIYTKVADYVNWIYDTINEWS